MLHTVYCTGFHIWIAFDIYCTYTVCIIHISLELLCSEGKLWASLCGLGEPKPDDGGKTFVTPHVFFVSQMMGGKLGSSFEIFCG